MQKITLYLKNGGVAGTVLVPVINQQPEFIAWGGRTFILKQGKYVEAFGLRAQQADTLKPAY